MCVCVRLLGYGYGSIVYMVRVRSEYKMIRLAQTNDAHQHIIAPKRNSFKWN